jgi:hypothetical protein
MLEAITRVMSRVNPELLLNPYNEHRQLPEEDPISKTNAQFPVFMRRGRSDGDTVVFAEVYWADLTRAAVETHQFFLSLIGFIYGVRHIALQASLIPGKLGAALSVILRLTVSLLLGPAFALFVFEFVIYTVYLLFFVNSWDETPNRSLVLTAQAATAIAVIGLSEWRRRSSNSIFWPSLVAIGSVTLLHVLLRYGGIADHWYNATLFPHLNVPRDTTPGEWPLTGFIIDFILDRLLASVAICLIVAGLIVLCAGRVHDPRSTRSMRTAWLAAVLLVALWEIAINPMDLVAQRAYDKSRNSVDPTYTLWFDDVCLAALAAALLASALGMLAIHARWSAANARRDPGKVHGVPPRLIIARPILYCMIIYATVFCPLAVVDGLDLCELRVGHIDYRWMNLLYTIGLVAILGWSSIARNILHILQDIVVHFADPSAERVFVWTDRRKPRYPVRHRIANRLRDVIELVLSESPCPTQLLILAHSQGTIIALEELRKESWKSRLAPLQSVTLLTFGSPLTNLYEEYFPLVYGDPTHDRWRFMNKTIHTWINIYRVDDYVGTSIKSSLPDWPTNLAFPPGRRLRGHTRYWEEAIFRHIRKWLP